MTDRPKLIEQVFEVALSLDTRERAAYLEEACQNAPEIREAVEDLLAQDAHVGSFLEHPPMHPAVAIPTASNLGVLRSQPAAGRFRCGQVLAGRFVIVRFIAQGGMGEVYEVEDTFLQGVHIALKTILPHIADDPELQLRFEREVIVARGVTHPNLCPIYDIFRSENPRFLFLTMKFLPGETLSQRLRGPAPATIEEGLAILKQMAAGLSAIHDAGIVHRDIKPNNIMLDGAGADVRLCITDFGLARAYEAEPSISGAGVVAGTPGYLAPELYQGEVPSRASDLYAFGVVMHMVFTGQKPPASAKGQTSVSSRLQSAGVPAYCVELIRQCLDHDPRRRCEAFDKALDLLKVRYRRQQIWTRRRFASAMGAAIFAGAGTAWWKRDELEDLIHPLPVKRFVALLNWPRTSDAHVTPTLTSVLSAIKNTLARAEAFDRDLFIISPEEAHVDVAGLSHLRDVCDPLGANLVLAATVLPAAMHFELWLRLLDPGSGQTFRERRLRYDYDEITSLPDRAVQAAASFLGLTSYLKRSATPAVETQSAAAFTAFHAAETLLHTSSDEDLDAAIEKYKDAINLDANYALAYARLAQAYVHYGVVRRNSAALSLARANAETALSLNPHLVEGQLAMAIVHEHSGDEQAALHALATALALDPLNSKALVWQGQLYTRINRWPDAENTFRRVLKQRPNYWFAYNELGFGLDGQGRYHEALEAFRAANLAAPKSSFTIANLGSEYLQVGEVSESIEALKRALALDPSSDFASACMSLAHRYQGKYEQALPFAKKAAELNPAVDTNWLELGDCYASMHNRKNDAKDAYLRAATEAERHLATDSTDGPAWMLLALYRVKTGDAGSVRQLIEKAERLGAQDVGSQVLKARILEQLGERDQALRALAACFRKGATDLQVAPSPDLQKLRKDPRYQELVVSKLAASNGAPREEAGMSRLALPGGLLL